MRKVEYGFVNGSREQIGTGYREQRADSCGAGRRGIGSGRDYARRFDAGSESSSSLSDVSAETPSDTSSRARLPN